MSEFKVSVCPFVDCNGGKNVLCVKEDFEQHAFSSLQHHLEVLGDESRISDPIESSSGNWFDRNLLGTASGFRSFNVLIEESSKCSEQTW